MSNYFDSQKVSDSQRLVLLNKMRFPKLEELLAQVKAFRDDDNWLKQHRDAIKILLGFAICYPKMLKPALETILSIWWFIQLTPEDTKWQFIAKEAIEAAQHEPEPDLAALAARLTQRLEEIILFNRTLWFNPDSSKLLERQPEKLARVCISIFEAWARNPNLKVIPEWCNIALNAAQQVGKVELLAEIQSHLASVYAVRIEYELAIEYGETSLKLWEGVPDNRSYLGKYRAAFALGLLYRLTRLPETAKKYTDMARKHADKDSSLSLGQWAYQQAALLYEKDRFAESVEWYQSALNMFSLQPQSEITRKKSIAKCLQGMALSQIWLRSFKKARANLAHAMRLWFEINDPWQIANNVYTCAFLEGRRGQVAEALQLLDEAMRLTDDMTPGAARDDLRISIEDTRSRLKRDGGGSRLHTTGAQSYTGSHL